MGTVEEALRQIREEGLHGITLPAPPGFQRGVDVLGPDLDRALGVSARVYRRNHGRAPNLINPITFTEKQVLFKFFAPIPVQSPSDKLRSVGYLPPAARDLARVPRRIWVSDKPELPSNEEIPAGSYYFKSNHSSGTNMPVQFPLSDEERAVLTTKAAHWLTKIHNQRLSLWWYESMPRNVYLEEDLRHPDGDAPDWKFFVCNGRVALFQVDTGRQTRHVQTIYDRAGRPLGLELYHSGGPPVAMPDDLPKMIRIAEAIGQNFDFIRVDMFRLRGEVYLGEIGLVPNGASTRIRSPEVDGYLGHCWDAPWLGRVDPDWGGGPYRGQGFDPDAVEVGIGSEGPATRCSAPA